MKNDSPLRLRGVTLFAMLLLLFAETSKALDYEDVENLLPTEPETTNDTLAAIVRDSVVQDAVQDAVGNGSLEGLVVKKKVLLMPATEPTKVVSEREQILVVPVTDLEDVRKNITETVDAATGADGLALTDVQFLTENTENASSEDVEEDDPSSYAPQHDFYELLTEASKTTREPMFDDTAQKISHSLAEAEGEAELSRYRPTSGIPVPIIALFQDPAKIADDGINVPMATVSAKRDDTPKTRRLSSPSNDRDEIRRSVQNYADASSLSVTPDNWRLLASTPSEVRVLPTPRQTNNVRSENSLPVLMPRVDVVTPILWTADDDANYPKEPRDMEVSADIVFRPLFRFRQEAQRRSWRRGVVNDYKRSIYRGYNSYNSYPRRNFRYRPRYPEDGYYY